MSTLIPFFASDRGKIFQEQQKDGQAKLKILRGFRRAKMQWDSTENRLNSSGNFFSGFSSLSISREIQNDLETKNIKPEDFKDRIIFMSMVNDMEWKNNDGDCMSNGEEVRNYAMKFLCKDIGRLWVQGRKRNGVGFPRSKKQWNCTANKMVPRLKETGHLVFKKHQRFESWDLEAKERQMYHSLQWRFYKYRTLVPNSSICQSAQCPRSSCELVSSIRLDRRRKRTRRYYCGQ